ncbi:hypothetical protein BGX31_009841 [Mortierella sp. GBA43]|nr:hypothetical protein BGX31_009841 [Mortierella sp. GBA43]
MIKVSPDDTVVKLKDTIKKHIAPKLDDVAVCDIQLWRVSIPVQGRSINAAIFLDSISPKRQLSPYDRLSQDDEDASREIVHIIIQLPVRQVVLDNQSSNNIGTINGAEARLLEDSTVLHLPLFGVSGCGKTRTAVEVLSRTWGLYFNAASEDHGSGDVQRLVQVTLNLHSNKKAWTDDLLKNTMVVGRLAFGLLYARLWILKFCLSIPGCDHKFTPLRWMLLQVATPVFTDVFDDLFRKITGLFLKHDDMNKIQELINTLFDEVQRQISSRPSFSPLGSRFVVVLDEAQVLSRHPSGSVFLDSDNTTPRPILAPILYSFRRIDGRDQGSGVCVIPCGTGLSQYDLAWSGGSARGIKLSAEEHVIKGNRIVVDFPGWVYEETVEEYLERLRLSVDTKSKDRLLELLPKAVVSKLFLELRGRFRPIISAIEDIIEANDPTRSEACITQRLHRLTTANIDSSDGDTRHAGNLCAELQRFMTLVEENPTTYPAGDSVKSTLKFATAAYIASGATTILEGNRLDLVEVAFGRIKKYEGKRFTAIDEPFALRAANNYFQKNDPGYLNIHSDVATIDDCARGRYWETMVPLNLVCIFHNKVVSKDLFRNLPPHELFEREAEIVGHDSLVQGIRHGDITMDQFLDAHYFHHSVLLNKTIPPFFFPKQHESGPDIVVVVRFKSPTSEGADILCPVFVQLKLRKGLRLSDAEHASSTVQPEKIENHGIKLDKYCQPHRQYISLIVAYPAEVSKFFDRENMVVTHGKDVTEILLTVDCHNICSLFSKEYVGMLDNVKRLYKEVTLDTAQSEESPRKKRRSESPK